MEGVEAWKQDEASDDYDHFLIRERLAEMRRLRAAGDVLRLVHALHEGLHGNLGNITSPSLYGFARVGTKRLIEEGRSHAIEGKGFDPGCPVRILQGYRDPDVPWQHALALLDLLKGDDVEFTLIKSGGHRLSEPEDLRRLIATVAALAAS